MGSEGVTEPRTHSMMRFRTPVRVVVPLPAASCPVCGGRRMADDFPVVDQLRFSHRRVPVECPLGIAEDATLQADWDRHPIDYHRPVTPTELSLLTLLGFRDERGNPPTAADRTAVLYGTGNIRSRRWPDLWEAGLIIEEAGA